MLISRSGDEKGEMVGESGCTKDVRWGKGGPESATTKRRHHNADAADRRSKKVTRKLPIGTLPLKRQLLIGSVQAGIRDQIRK